MTIGQMFYVMIHGTKVQGHAQTCYCIILTLLLVLLKLRMIIGPLLIIHIRYQLPCDLCHKFSLSSFTRCHFTVFSLTESLSARDQVELEELPADDVPDGALQAIVPLDALIKVSGISVCMVLCGYLYGCVYRIQKKKISECQNSLFSKLFFIKVVDH